jgi:hypothetical protein
MKPKMKELKHWLITNAVEIRETKKIHKENQRSKNDHSLMWSLYKMSQDYRHHHIAYSELRGRTRDQIEKPKSDNLPNEDKIQRIKEEYSDEQQALCASS